MGDQWKGGPARRHVPFSFSIEGREISARPGDTIASAILRQGSLISIRKDGEPSGIFCGMGSCFDCAVTVDGHGCTRACMTPARPGMNVVRGSGHLAATGVSDEVTRLLCLDDSPVDVPVIKADVAVVGAGPAGLAAAAEAAKAGLCVVIVDEGESPGGRYLRARHTVVSVRGSASDTAGAFRAALLTTLAKGNVDILSNATVWGVFHDRQLAIHRDARLQIVEFRVLVLAPGAYERTIPFPGWTLPGVMTAGAARDLVGSYGVMPGKRVVVAGSGPFLYSVANELVTAGCSILGVFQASRIAAAARLLPHFWGHWVELRDALHHLGSLRAAGVPVRFRTAVVAARGTDRVEEAVVAALDSKWRPVPRTERVVACDVVCVGFGFQPATEIPMLLGCEMFYDGLRGGWVPVVNDDGRTSLPNVYVAGEVAGIGGGTAALAEGHVVGIAAAASLGALDGTTAARRASPHHDRARRARAFADRVLHLFRIQPGLVHSVPDATVVCRCESVTAGEVRATASEWSPDLRIVRALSRAGMGLCQGRTCLATVAELVRERTGSSLEQSGPPSLRPPLRPLSLSFFTGHATAVTSATSGWGEIADP